MQVRFQRPWLPPAEAIGAYYAASEEARWFSNGGPCHDLLVARLAARVPDGSHLVPVANCTSGLMLALRALTTGERGSADRTEVLVPSFTFAATAGAIVWAGLQPVFVDVDERHWMLSAEALTQALEARGDRVAAVVAGSTFGAPPPAGVGEAWETACAAHGVPLVVDAAAGFGGRRADGTPVGGTGDVEVFSFHATKPFAIGEGGLVCTADAQLAADIASLANFGFDAARTVQAAGINAKLSEWACATGLAVDDRYDELLAARRSSAHRIAEELRTAADLTFQGLDAEPTWQFVPALAASGADRNRLAQAATAAGVEVRDYFSPALHDMPGFADAPRADALDATRALSARTLSLPMAADLTPDEEQAIVSALATRSTA